jgi:hypothetical protein
MLAESLGDLLQDVLHGRRFKPDCRKRKRGHLHIIVCVDLGSGHIESRSQSIQNTPNHLTFILQRPGFPNQQPDFEGAYNHFENAERGVRNEETKTAEGFGSLRSASPGSLVFVISFRTPSSEFHVYD